MVQFVQCLQAASLANETALEAYRRAGVTKIRWGAPAPVCAFSRNLDREGGRPG